MKGFMDTKITTDGIEGSGNFNVEGHVNITFERGFPVLIVNNHMTWTLDGNVWVMSVTKK